MQVPVREPETMSGFSCPVATQQGFFYQLLRLVLTQREVTLLVTVLSLS